ncbi:MAG: GNAT family N-acetyltransferase [Lysobacterales bacterium]
MSPETQAIPSSIETARLSLRRLAPGDCEFYCGLYADPVVMRLVGPVLGRTRARRAFDRLHDESRDPVPGFRVWVIHAHGDPEPVGLCGLTEKVPGAGRAELGILLIPPAWGRGIAREALAALMHGPCRPTYVREFLLRHRRENRAMAKIALRLGLNPLPSPRSDACCLYSNRRRDQIADLAAPWGAVAGFGSLHRSIADT